jgi:hypothetical protein
MTQPDSGSTTGHSAARAGVPDLSTPQARQAYLAELGTVARGWRWSGFALLGGGIAALSAERWFWTDAPEWLRGVGFGGLLAGAAAMLVAIVVRTRYHARRMKGS